MIKVMLLNKQYEALMRSMRSHYNSSLETFTDRDAYTQMANERGELTYTQMLELKMKHPEEYEELFHASSWD